MIKSFYMGLMRPINSPGDDAQGQQSLLSAKLLIRIFVSVGILAFLVAWLTTDALVAALLSVSAQLWILVISLFAIGHVVSAMKWRLMLGATGVNVRTGLSIRAHFAGLFANLCLPSIVGGDLIRAALVIREQKSDMAAIALGSLVDRLNDVLALIIIASLASFLMPPSSEHVTGNILPILAVALLTGVAAGIFFVRFVPRTVLPNFLRGIFDKLSLALNSLMANPATAIAGLLLSLFIQGGFVGLNFILAQAMAIDASLLLWMFAWPMAKLIALAPISLGGIGVREVALAGLLAPFGVEASLAVAQSLSWELILIFTGLFSGVAVAMIPSRSKDLDQDNTSD